MQNLTYKPNKRAFYFMTLFGAVIGSGLLTLLGLYLLVFLSFVLMGLFIVGLAILWLALSLLNMRAMYKKRTYTLADKAIHYTTGSLFSDKETELTYRNITHVRLVKPFVEYRLFGTGQIQIDAAGSSGTEVLMMSLANPDEVYAQIQRVMATRGFGLTYQNLRSQEQPAPIAVVLEILGAVFGMFFFVFFFLGLGGAIATVIDVVPPFIIVSGTMLVLLLAIATVYVYYQDLIRRRYYIYDDVICYERGFLTRQQAFIPVENLSDSELNQTFIDKVLDLYDVVISCQGSSSEIRFKNLRNGKQVETIIDELINTKPAEPIQAPTTAPAQAQTQAADVSSATQQPSVTTAAAPAAPFVEDATVRSYYQDTKRVLLPYAPLILVLWLVPFLIVFPVWGYIVAKRIEYKLGVNSVGSYFNFLTTKNIEFSKSKITGLVITRDIFDRWLGTCSVGFWSIGSAQAVTFRHIPYEAGIANLMQAKAGIPNDETLAEYRPEFTFARMLRSNIYVSIFIISIFVIMLALSLFAHILFVIIPVIIAIVSAVTWYVLLRRYRHAQLRIGQFSTYLQVGWLRQQSFYVLQDNIKDISSTVYPMDTAGVIQFNVAGEQVQQSNGSQSNQRVPNHFKIGYMNGEGGVRNLHDTVIDNVLDLLPNSEQLAQAKQAGARQLVSTSQPAIANDVFVIVLIHVIVFPLIFFLPVSLLARIVWLRAVRYNVESDRVVKQSGIVYKSQTSIIFKRIDYMKHGQRLLNKMFKNGNIYIFTTGSSTAELTLRSVPDYLTIHASLNKKYEQ